MIDLIPSVSGLVGVIIGGLISYTAQKKHQQNMEKRKDRREKHIAYNQFLLLDGIRSPVFYNQHNNLYEDFEWSIYSEGSRKILYENLHLFDKEIAESVLQIDTLNESSEVMGVEPEDVVELCNRYIKIRKAIQEDYQRDI